MLAMAARGEAYEGDWLIAERQTAGRGRQGRVWDSPRGNIHASGLVTVRAGDPSAPTLALVAAVAVHDALGVAESVLKWPNDLLVGPAKFGGVLLERQNDAVVIGIGINLAHHPDLPDRPTTSLAALGIDLSPDTAIAALATAFAHWVDIWRTFGLSPVRDSWTARTHPIGTSLSAARPDGTRIVGAFGGLDDDGALILRLADGTARVIHAGDVFLI